METVEFLAKVTLFKHLETGVLEQLATQIRLLSLPESIIVKENDPVDGLYIIKSGLAKVTRSAETGKTEAVLAILRRGDSFGELGLIDGLPRSATVIAMQPVECYFLPREAFLNALEKYPDIARAMLPALVAMVRTADQWVARIL